MVFYFSKSINVESKPMGGHGEHHEIKIPDWRIYKVDNVSELIRVRELLAQKGIKNPWLRNDVWRWHPGYGTTSQRIKMLFFRGFKVAFGLMVLTVATDKIYHHYYPVEDDHH